MVESWCPDSVKGLEASGLIASWLVPAGKIEVKVAGAFQKVLLVIRRQLGGSGRFFIGGRGCILRVVLIQVRQQRDKK